MENILFGLALGPLLAVAIVIALELLVSVVFWYLLELLVQGASTGFRSIVERLARIPFSWRYDYVD